MKVIISWTSLIQGGIIIAAVDTWGAAYNSLIVGEGSEDCKS
jgi:hypothetical protein